MNNYLYSYSFRRYSGFYDSKMELKVRYDLSVKSNDVEKEKFVVLRRDLIKIDVSRKDCEIKLGLFRYYLKFRLLKRSFVFDKE